MSACCVLGSRQQHLHIKNTSIERISEINHHIWSTGVRLTEKSECRRDSYDSAGCGYLVHRIDSSQLDSAYLSDLWEAVLGRDRK